MGVSLHVLLARHASRAVILRRGPTKHVRLIAWDRARDTFERGQWFKGRIYEHRCDLSPSGRLFAYFAANHKPGPGCWTAISQPPFFTALALWPMVGTYGGGGLFESERVFGLGHAFREAKLDPKFTLPKNFSVSPLWGSSADDQDRLNTNPRLHRDGWRCIQPGRPARQRQPSAENPFMFSFDEPPIHQCTNPERFDLSLERKLLGIHEPNGRFEVFEWALVVDNERLPLGRLDWADWDRNGDLLFARDGQVFRDVGATGGDAKVLCDFRDDTFEPMVAPEWARQWPRR